MMVNFRTRAKSEPDYELLLYECHRDKTELERRIRELEAELEKLRRENRMLRQKLKIGEEFPETAGEGGEYRQIGTPLAW